MGPHRRSIIRRVLLEVRAGAAAEALSNQRPQVARAVVLLRVDETVGVSDFVRCEAEGETRQQTDRGRVKAPTEAVLDD